MKRFSEKKLYETTIKKLMNTRFYKGETAYRFAWYNYDKGVYMFVFCPESEYIKHNGDINAIMHAGENINGLANRLYYQHIDDYAETYNRNCEMFDKCEDISVTA